MSYIENKNISNLSDEEWNKIKHLYVPGKVFDFKKRKKNLLEVKKILDGLGISFFLVHGVLLGAYREKNFIKYDNDIELDIFEEEFRPRLEKVYNAFIEAGFVIRVNKKRKACKMNLYKYREKISIRGIYLEAGYKNNKFRMTNCFRYPKKFYKNFVNIKFKGKTFKAPGPIESYLLYVYGDTWSTPLKSKDRLIKFWNKNNILGSSKERKKWGK